MNNLNQKFQTDLNGIAQDLISHYNLEFKKQINGLSCPLMRWLDFRLRYIDPKPRQIVFSEVFPKKLPKTVETGFLHIQKLMRMGVDINAYQSKSIQRFHDISGKRKAKRTDLLWADWNIFHLHITDIPIKPGELFSERKCSDGRSWLLFFLVENDTFALIDVREHNDDGLFSDNELIILVNHSWPNYMEQFHLRDILPPQKTISPREIQKLRLAGINIPIILNGKAYFGPGLGITSAATSTRVMESTDKARHWIRKISEIAKNPEGQIQKHILDNQIKHPDLNLCITPKGLAIFEETSNTAFTVLNHESPESYLSIIHNLVFPSWALKSLII
ncbi:hypothetical protein ACQE3E_02975 [Methylomonas sp. MED-D]|uniref:hypothetical protein n=1 Tax=unclassified Methylomonas TaxID=2608980 RepID=UPI0028A2FFFC|nr:hypothetical protein [Methylomonas sp. MV1]MDT4330129.1 hypothetical protein [Methylomonas sp. MV1]